MWRWRAVSAADETVLDIWLDTEASGPPCDLWVIEPSHPSPYRYEVSTRAELAGFIGGVRERIGDPAGRSALCARAAQTDERTPGVMGWFGRRRSVDRRH
jgi:hypothetical protein